MEHENPQKKSRAKTLSVSAVLEYPNTTMLHASVMVEGNKDTHDNQQDYAADLFKDIQELLSSPSVVVDEHHCD